MPELPEVETTRRSLLPYMEGVRIDRVELRREDLRFPFPKDFAARLTGARVLDIRRRAKYLLFDLDSGDVMLAHLGMSGSFSAFEAEYRPLRAHDHVLLHLSNQKTIIYNDPRRFGIMDLFPKNNEETHKLLKDMGPEPLSKAFSPVYLVEALKTHKSSIKPVLMDQKIVVGVGNIYASESLFLAGIHPATPANQISGVESRLVSSIQKTLSAAIESGGSTLRNFIGADGASGYFQHHFNVYNRKDLPCFACDAPIAHVVQAGRATYFCPQCQKQSSRHIERAKKMPQKKQ